MSRIDEGDGTGKANQYAEERHGAQRRVRNGSPTYYNLLQEMAEIHDRKSHDYASNDNPSGNYHFAGKLAQLFAHSHEDAGFLGRLGEKFYRLANLESSQKIIQNESIEDTEGDIAVITALWMSDRRDRRRRKLEGIQKIREQMNRGEWSGTLADKQVEPEYRSGSIIESTNEAEKEEKTIIDVSYIDFIPMINRMNDGTLEQLEIYVRRLLSNRKHKNPTEIHKTVSPSRTKQV